MDGWIVDQECECTVGTIVNCCAKCCSTTDWSYGEQAVQSAGLVSDVASPRRSLSSDSQDESNCLALHMPVMIKVNYEALQPPSTETCLL